MEIWYRTNHFKRAPDNEITAEINFPGESLWFDGHFPKEPVLPGIAQLAVVHDLLRRAFGEKLAVQEITRVRFKRKVGPGDQLAITVTPGDAPQNSYRFRMTCADEPVCNGILKVEREKEND